MEFRYFDPEGRQIPPHLLPSMDITTPAMEHVFAVVAERLEKAGKQRARVESPASS